MKWSLTGKICDFCQILPGVDSPCAHAGFYNNILSCVLYNSVRANISIQEQLSRRYQPFVSKKSHAIECFNSHVLPDHPLYVLWSRLDASADYITSGECRPSRLSRCRRRRTRWRLRLLAGFGRRWRHCWCWLVGRRNSALPHSAQCSHKHCILRGGGHQA